MSIVRVRRHIVLCFVTNVNRGSFYNMRYAWHLSRHGKTKLQNLPYEKKQTQYTMYIILRSITAACNICYLDMPQIKAYLRMVKQFRFRNIFDQVISQKEPWIPAPRSNNLVLLSTVIFKSYCS